MYVYRIAKQKYIRDLSGAGAKLVGGRWNFKGTPVLYTSENRALALLEVFVHLPGSMLPENYFLAEIEIPDTIPIESIPDKSLPKNWNELVGIDVLKQIGNKWIEAGKFAVLKVPSAIVQGEFNYLVNPMHPDSKKIKVKEIKLFEFEKRLF